MLYLFLKPLIHIMRYLKKHKFFKIFWHIWQYTYGSVIVFWVLYAVLNTGVSFACLRAVGKHDLSVASLKLNNKYSQNMSEFSLIMMKEIPDSWAAFLCLVSVSPLIYLFSYLRKEKENSCHFLHTSMVSMWVW